MLKQMNAEIMFIKASQQAIISELAKLTGTDQKETWLSIEALQAKYILGYEKILNGILDVARNNQNQGNMSIEDFLSKNP